MSSEFLRTGTGELKQVKRGPLRAKPREHNKAPVGEFRVLVIGAKGVGKTSILTRVSRFLCVPCNALSVHTTRLLSW